MTDIMKLADKYADFHAQIEFMSDQGTRRNMMYDFPLLQVQQEDARAALQSAIEAMQAENADLAFLANQYKAERDALKIENERLQRNGDIANLEFETNSKTINELSAKLVQQAEKISGERLPRCKKCGDAIFSASSDACPTCNNLPAPKQFEPKGCDKPKIEKAVLTLIYSATFGSTARYEDGTPTENRLLQLECARYLHSLVSTAKFESVYELTLREFDATPSYASVEGWRLVPIEPTQGMLDVARVTLQEVSRTMARHSADKAAYRALLAAAPTPSEQADAAKGVQQDPIKQLIETSQNLGLYDK